jgi:hypothetical protein
MSQLFILTAAGAAEVQDLPVYAEDHPYRILDGFPGSTDSYYWR